MPLAEVPMKARSILPERLGLTSGGYLVFSAADGVISIIVTLVYMSPQFQMLSVRDPVISHSEDMGYPCFYKMLMLQQLMMIACVSAARLQPTMPAEKKALPTEKQEETVLPMLCQSDMLSEELVSDRSVPDTLSIANLSTITGRDRFCRLYDLHINLSDIGWTHIVQPKTINIRACVGRCGQPTKTYHGTVHAQVLSLWLGRKTHEERRRIKEITPSCSPKILSAAAVLRKTDDGDLVPGLLSDVIAESCQCV